jgi:hypothetical protein
MRAIASTTLPLKSPHGPAQNNARLFFHRMPMRCRAHAQALLQGVVNIANDQARHAAAMIAMQSTDPT